MANFEKVDELFRAALRRSPERRSVFLEQACGGDADLRREVEELLAANGQTEDFLGAVVGAEAAALAAEQPASWSGREIGPYRLFRELGHGGMGAVYLAARVDDEFRQQVTVKLIKPGMDSQGILRRFKNERQILAGLHHPSIAQLLDGGTTPEGQPYFVMEYIEGLPIDRYCDRHKLPVDKRLELFATVCAAVHYAHQNLVVHRDLKPDNIMVTGEGAVKLLDFGIAKLLNPGLSDQTYGVTGVDLMAALTPAYASPEQVRGAPITTAADIYSLGILLYELLTGHRPYHFMSHLPMEIERVVCDTEPERPSTVVRRVEETGDGEPVTPEGVSEVRACRPESLRRKLAGDLDNIVLMALRKEPQRRYASARQLADDLDRHRRGLPVIARADTLVYRTSKFVRRHKLGVAFVAFLFFFAVAMSVLAFRVQREAERADQEAAAARQVSEFLVTLFESSNPFAPAAGDVPAGGEITAREILDRGARRLEEELAEQPEIQARLMNTVGTAYAGLGDYETAGVWIGKALARRQELFGDEHLEVAESRAELGEAMLGRGQLPRAEALYSQSLDSRRRLLGDEHPLVAESLVNLGHALHAQGDGERAEELYRQALDIQVRSLGENNPEVAVTLNNLALVLRQRSEYEEAKELYQRALEISRRELGEDHVAVAFVLNNLAVVFHSEDDYAAAEKLYRQALEIYDRRFAAGEHPEQVRARGNLAALLQSRGEHRQAVELNRQVLASYRRLLGNEHPQVALILNNLASSLVEIGGAVEAEAVIGESLEIFRRTAPEHWRLAQAENTLGACLTALGRYPEAEPLLLASYPILRHQTGDSAYTRAALRRLVTLYEAWGRAEKTAEYRLLLSP